jgi:hypothetical protein
MNNQVLSNPYLADDLKQVSLDKDMQSVMPRQNISRDEVSFSGASGLLGGSNDLFTPISSYGRSRSGSFDFGSDSSSASQSIPSSAASSSINLPLDVSSRQQQPVYHNVNHPRDTPVQVQYQVDHDLRHSASHPHLQREGGFSSAFGLMSIDDPNAISADGAPFFSSAAMNMPPQDPNVTPMPLKQRDRGSNVAASLATVTGPAREAETRELRDFWKAYIHTPLTGPSPSVPDAANAGPATSNQRHATSPSGARRVRVASLPSVKTPTADVTEYVNGTQHNTLANNGMNGSSSVCATLHGNADDLRSYEAAVLARKAPKLNLVLKRGRESASASSASPPGLPSREVPISVVNGNYSLSRPSSSSSTSSLAFAFGGDHGGSSATYPQMRDGLAAVPDNSFVDSPSGESSVSEEGSSDRPSFKRLPSQTLGPAYSKRALLSSESDDEYEASRLHSNAGALNITNKSLNGVDSGKDRSCPRPTVNLTERHRRMSNPTSHVPPVSMFSGVRGQEVGKAVQ